MNQYQNQKQNQQQKQGYYMSQQHLKLMHIMHLSGFALQEYIANEIELNPVLEMESEPDVNQEEASEEDEFDSELLWEQDDEPYEKNTKPAASETHYEAPVVQYYSLQENLKDQIQMMNLPEETCDIAFYLIDELDDDGYLRRPVAEVADDYGFSTGKLLSEEMVKNALQEIQRCEPAGIGARDLHECLLLQLRRKPKGCRILEITLHLLEDHYQSFVQRQFMKLKTELNITSEDLEKCITYISKLNPKPVTETNRYELLKEQIIPDFEVTADEHELIVSLTSSEFVKLRVNTEYATESGLSTKNNTEKKQVENYFQNLVNDANSLVNALKERETTMMKVMTAIVQMQPDFFKSGDTRELRPMILQDIANKTAYDLSTISRITSNKHVQTPFGIFSLKNLFMRAISSERTDASPATSIQVQELIQQIVKEENKAKPLSDTDIMQLLKAKEITIARRTVVKYRELSGIPNSEMRRKQQLASN
ncbi:MAG: RNA polymerase factor sigma-54 [Bacteroidia bacterium]